MIKVLTAVKDEAGNCFKDFQVQETCAVAIRGFAAAVQENKFIMKNAKDFNLYFLGNWDNETGQLTAHQPSIIATAEEFKIEEKESK